MTNETFYDLLNPAMPTERATVRIYTTPERLEHYLKRKRVLEVRESTGFEITKKNHCDRDIFDHSFRL